MRLARYSAVFVVKNTAHLALSERVGSLVAQVKGLRQQT